MNILEKSECGEGWNFLLEKFSKLVESKQKQWLKTVDNVWVPAENNGEFLAFKLLQAKEKWGILRIYYAVEQINHDWIKFDKEDYEKEFMRARCEIDGYAACLEAISGEICEISGQRGRLRNSKGWMKTLSDEEAAKMGYTD